MSTLIIKTVTRAAAPVIMLFSLYLLLRGHQLPGGGFIAGLMSSSAVILVYLAYGFLFNTKDSSHSLFFLFSMGLTFAFGTGLAGLVFGKYFLKSGFTHLHMPIIHEKWEFASAFGFDFGVYLVVCGVTCIIITLLGEENNK